MKDAHKNFIEMSDYLKGPHVYHLRSPSIFQETIIQRLNEQLKEANMVITSYIRNNPLEKYGPAEAYCERYGVE